MCVSNDPSKLNYQLYKLTIFGSFLYNSSRALPKEPLSSSKETWKKKIQVRSPAGTDIKTVLVPNEGFKAGKFQGKRKKREPRFQVD